MDNLSPNPHKNLIVGSIIVLVIVALAIGYIYWREADKTAEEKAGEVVEQALKDAAKSTLPTVNTDTTQGLPQTNPVEKANPFGNTYKNPFE
ncbi:MAG: hypothetical protein Q8O87_00080 [bacterium]|nr:hypothetical protein [bacterium]